MKTGLSPKSLLPTILVLSAVLLTAGSLRAQPGALDPDFYRNSVFDDVVFALAVQPDGKVLVAGAFTSVTGVPSPGVARVKSDGSLDATFHPGLGAEGRDGAVYALALYTNGVNAGKVVVAGSFTSFNRVARRSIARLNPDGTLDASFDPGSGVEDGLVYAVGIQADGKIVVGGTFTTVRGASRSGIARFNADGTLDTSFAPGTGTHGAVVSLAVQPDGKIVIGGMFFAVQGAFRNGIARLTSTGSVEPLSTFDPGRGADGGYVYAVALQTDGRIVVAGDFTAMQGESRDGVARLNPDGSLDMDFAPDSGGANYVTVWAVAPVPGDRVLVAGEFDGLANAECDGIALLDATGNVDPSFTNPVPDAVRFSVHHGEYVLALALQPNGSVVAGGTFELVNNLYRAALARLRSDGNVDPVFNQESGTFDAVLTSAVQPDGKPLLGGQFTLANGVSRRGLARLNADGLLDASFDPGAGAVGQVFSLAVYTNGPLAGKIVIGGVFTKVNNITVSGLARLDANGGVDTSFSSLVLSNDVQSLALQSDGKIVIGGSFTNVNGAVRNRVARLNSDGSLDATFDPGGGAVGGPVFSVVVQIDGRLVIGGAFTNFNGIPRSGVARLDASGGLDGSFDPGSGVAGGGVHTVAVQPSGAVLVGGSFTTARGLPRAGVARFNPDGALDAGFAPGAGIGNGEVRILTLQTNGQILIGGSFTNFNHIAAAGIARLNLDGSYDYGFDPGSGVAQAKATVQSLSVQPDGKVLVGGSFLKFDGADVWFLTRLLGGAAAPTSPSLRWWPDSQTALSGETVSFSVAASGSRPLSYQWRFNATTLLGQTNASLDLPNVATNQAGAYTVIITNTYGSLTSPPIALTVIAAIDLGQAVNAPGLVWTTSGDRNWFGQSAVTHDGIAAAQSGLLGDDQQTTLSTTVTGPGRLTFWWKVSSEQGYDLLNFMLNGSTAAEITGEVGWQQRTVQIPNGPSTLAWVYSKDVSGSQGRDEGGVDQVNYAQAPTLIPAMLRDGTLQVAAQAAIGQQVEVQASTDLTRWTTIATLTNETGTISFVDDTVNGFPWRFYRTRTQ